MNVSLRRAACSLVVLFGSAALLLGQQAAPPTQPRAGQQRVQPRQPGQPGQPGQFGRLGQGGAGAQQLEPSIVTLLIIDNNKEIALAQLGQQTSQNEHVKHFCEMIVKDHSNFVQKLQEQTAAGRREPGIRTGTVRERGAAAPPARPLSPTAGAQPDTGAAQPDATAQPQREATAQQDRKLRQQREETRTAADQEGRRTGQRITVAKPVIGNQPGAGLLELHHDVAEAGLERARREAEMLGQEFDMHFMGGQIVAHKALLDKLQVFQQHVSPQTRQLLADAQESVQKHLAEAESIHENLSKEGGREGAETRRGDRTETRQERE
jgi:predicted outer membrane protein